MLNLIDSLLNRITMYRLVLYVLIALLTIAAVFGFFGWLPYSSVSIIYSALFITLICWLINTIAAWVFDAPTNVESVYITALILALIINPITALNFEYFAFIFWVATLAMVSKYFLAIGKKHLFNPAALAVATTAVTISQGASWWVGTVVMLPFVVMGGFLVVRKIKTADLFWSFFTAAAATILAFALLGDKSPLDAEYRLLINSPLIFFATIMLTEPLTTPPTKNLRIIYGALVGFLFAPQIHIDSIFSTPELALLVGNLFAYLVSPKQKLLLQLKEKIQLAPSIFNFIFQPGQKLKFKPGQYMEWTLEHDSPDSRGNRRYFTIASSPTEDELILGVKFYDPPSSYKKGLLDLPPDGRIVASQLAGDFVLPKDPNQKLVFIAGGIGVTPFRSMIKYLLDRNEKRPIVIFYSNRSAEDVVYHEIFQAAAEQLNIQTIFTITNPNTDPAWQGHRGIITADIIKQEVPDFAQRTFYLSGPRSMVTAFEKTLSTMGLKNNQIKADYFPGFI